jgi:molybdopterin-guanine dinucleotide biosynthesis protein A
MVAATERPERAEARPLHSIADGFVLAGGLSTRMGRSKAMLPWQGTTLLEYVAAQVRLATGSVRLVGTPERVRQFSLEAIPDAADSCGPVGGIVAALRACTRRWALITACDLPNLDWRRLGTLWTPADDLTAVDAVVPQDAENRLHPLCALYRQGSLPAWETALRDGTRRLQTVLETLHVRVAPQPDPHWLTNVNTPAEWQTALEGTP